MDVKSFITLAPGNPYRRLRLSTVDLFKKIAWFLQEKRKKIIIKAADLKWLVLGGQLYQSLPFNMDIHAKPFYPSLLFVSEVRHFI